MPCRADAGFSQRCDVYGTMSSAVGPHGCGAEGLLALGDFLLVCLAGVPGPPARRLTAADLVLFYTLRVIPPAQRLTAA